METEKVYFVIIKCIFYLSKILFFTVIFCLIIYKESEVLYEMKTLYITKEYLYYCNEIAKNYIKHTRGWSESDYVLKFRYVDKRKNFACISAIHNSVFEDIQQKILKDGCLKMIYNHPDEVDILIDLIELRVLSENKQGTFFPHAGKPLPYPIP